MIYLSENEISVDNTWRAIAGFTVKYRNEDYDNCLSNRTLHNRRLAKLRFYA